MVSRRRQAQASTPRPAPGEVWTVLDGYATLAGDRALPDVPGIVAPAVGGGDMRRCDSGPCLPDPGALAGVSLAGAVLAHVLGSVALRNGHGDDSGTWLRRGA